MSGTKKQKEVMFNRKKWALQGKRLEPKDAREIVVIHRYITDQRIKINSLYEDLSEMRDKIGGVHDRMKAVEKSLGIMIERIGKRKRETLLLTEGAGSNAVGIGTE